MFFLQNQSYYVHDCIVNALIILSFYILSITNMNFFYKQQTVALKMPKRQISSTLKYKAIEQKQALGQQNHDENDNEDKLSISMPSNRQSQTRIIHKSMINRSCINTCNFSCRNLLYLPSELLQFSDHKLRCLQKIDLSFNCIAELTDVNFQKLISLKEFIIHDNQISQIPNHKINNCHQLIFVNFDNNQLASIPALNHVKFMMARNNPLKLITSELISLTQIQFIAFDWLEYLIDTSQYVESSQKFKGFVKEYQAFKTGILANIDYSKEENNSYCDFHCYFMVYINDKQRRVGQGLFSTLIGRAILRTDDFFLTYLKNYHNATNFAKLTYNSHLMLELALQSNNKEALEIFKMRKINYSELVDEQTYFQSVKLCCYYNCYDMFKYLICIRSRKNVLLNKVNLEILIKVLIQRFNKQKDGDKLLSELIRLWAQISKEKIKINLPQGYNSKIFKSMSFSLFQIYSNQELMKMFQIQSEGDKTTPLHFAMRSKNQQLTHKLLSTDNRNIFSKNYCGISSKFIYGSTQISRKMVWYKEKKSIKKYWKEQKGSKISNSQSALEKGNQIQLFNYHKNEINLQDFLKNRIAHDQFKNSLSFYKKPSQIFQQSESKIKRNTKFVNKRSQKYLKNEKKQLFVKYLKNYFKIYTDLNWKSNYKKKMTYQDILEVLLLLISSEEEEDYMSKMQKSQKMIDTVKQLFDSLGSEDQVIKYQMMQTIFMLFGSSQTQKAASISDSNFWCCQNVIYE